MEESVNYNDLILSYHKLLSLKRKHRWTPRPTFIGVGAGRSGTSSIYVSLNRHPQVHMSPIKEINFFGIRDKVFNPNGISFHEYLNYFIGARRDQQIGEISPAYLSTERSLKRLITLLPTVKIIITLREPIERCISQYKHHSNNHSYNDINQYFRDGIQQIKDDSVPPNDWYTPGKNILQSCYSTGVEQLLDHYTPEKVFMVDYAHLRQDFERVMKDLFDFLEVDTNIPVETKRQNVSHKTEQILEEEVKEQLMEFFEPDSSRVKELTGINL